jgi:DNA-binding CsgD family transcriptional regulator
MVDRRSKEHLSARVWPGIHERLVPETDRRLGEIMAWADENGEEWIFEFLNARSKAVQENDADAPMGKIPPEDFLAVRFSLTSAQAKVLCAFLAGQTLQKIADSQGVTINTVRTHFVQVRGKLGARDQADVVRIALLGTDEGRA